MTASPSRAETRGQGSHQGQAEGWRWGVGVGCEVGGSVGGMGVGRGAGRKRQRRGGVSRRRYEEGKALPGLTVPEAERERVRACMYA